MTMISGCQKVKEHHMKDVWSMMAAWSLTVESLFKMKLRLTTMFMNIVGFNNQHIKLNKHILDCSRFWECSPQGACLTSCAPCDMQCGNYDGLVFDCRYQFPVGPVCDFPDNVNCTNGYTTDTNYPTHPTVPTTTTPEGYCKSDADCTGSSCSHCVNHACVDPECCTDDECGDITNMVCSVCDMETCSQPECCADADCPAVTDRICSVCSMDTCSRPECCVDDDCQVI